MTPLETISDITTLAGFAVGFTAAVAAGLSLWHGHRAAKADPGQHPGEHS